MTIIHERVGLRQTDADETTAPEPLWVVRVNPLARQRLGDPELRHVVAGLVAAERATAEAAAVASAALYALIGAAADPTASRVLLDARRSVHRDKAPKPGLTELVEVVEVERWLALRADRDAWREQLQTALEPAGDRERRTFAAMLSDEDFRRSLALVAPEAAAQADRYRDAVDADVPVPARVRKSERGLLQYLTRAMARTSPLGRFTAVGLAVPDADGIALGDVDTTGATAFPGLERAMLGFVLGGLVPPRDTAELLDSHIGLSATSFHDGLGRTLYFTQRTDGQLRRMSVPVDGVVGHLLLATIMGPRTVRAVAMELAERTGQTPTQALGLVAAAVRRGMFSTYAGPELGTPRVADLLATPVARGADVLARVAPLLGEVADCDPRQRPAAVAALESTLAELGEVADRPSRITVEEDFILPPLTVATGPHVEALADVSATVEVLTVFDWLHDVRILLHRTFIDRFGAGARVPLVEHSGALLDEATRRSGLIGRSSTEADRGAMREFGTADGALEALHEVRLDVAAAFRDRIGAAHRDGVPEVRFSRAEVLDLVADLPPRLRRDPLAYAVMLQDAGGRLVVNDGLPGHGMLYSRFLDFDRQLGGDAIDRVARQVQDRYGHDGVRVVEDVGLHRMNVNAHPQILPTALGADDWFGLSMVHDAETDTLGVEDADGRPLRVIGLGTGHPRLLPTPMAVATCLSSAGRLNNDFLDTWQSGSGWDGTATLAVPGISIGEVVVSRRRWYGGTELTALVDVVDDGQRLAGLTRWRATHDVPEEVFLKTTAAEMWDRPAEESEAVLRPQRHKPQYVDLASSLSTRVLPRMVARRTEGAGVGDVEYVEEARPGVSDGDHACEWVVEIGRRPGGTYHYRGSTS